MEHPFFPTSTTRAEAFQWLTIAEKLLSSRDLVGSKSFATRARDSGAGLHPAADQILAVVDTLLAGDVRIGNSHLTDWYGVLRLSPPQQNDHEFVANQYKNLVLLLNPQKNSFPYADQAFRLVYEAWSVLSDPLRKSLYDKELAFYLQQQQQQQSQVEPDPFSNHLPAMQQQNQPDPFGNHLPAMQQQNFMFLGGASVAPPPQMHVAGSGCVSVAPPPQQSNFPNVQQVNAAMVPMSTGWTREPQNFMPFGSGFVYGSGSESGHQPVNDPGLQEGAFSGFVGGSDVGSASVVNQELVNDNSHNKQKQPQEHNTDTANYDVNVSVNVGEIREDEAGEVDIEEEIQEEMEEVAEEQERVEEPVDETVKESTFWTACPYCYYIYEYASVYTDCCMRCQNCKRAFQAVVIPSPPPIVDGQESYFCCWGYFPLGFSVENWEKNKGAESTWTPFSPMFTSPSMGVTNNVKKKRGGRNSGTIIYIDDDDDEVYVDISGSDESDDDWHHGADKRKKPRNVKEKGTPGTPNKSTNKTLVEKGKGISVQDGVEMPNASTGELGMKDAMPSARRQPGRVAKSFGKLDLNVELSNEAEEPAQRANVGIEGGRGEEDNIEGNGFFEGLDEFLSNLPILNVVGDDKAVKAS